MMTLTPVLLFALKHPFAASVGAQPVSSAEAAKDSAAPEGNPVPDAKAKVAESERPKARAERKAEVRRANKAGEITSKGEASL